jgi:hypothetical protein
VQELLADLPKQVLAESGLQEILSKKQQLNAKKKQLWPKPAKLAGLFL